VLDGCEDTKQLAQQHAESLQEISELNREAHAFQPTH